MSQEHFEEMLDYYQQEMMYLLQSGSRFADRYPRIARNLDLSSAGSSDPHVRRLLESFAFLTGRLQKEVDDKFIKFTNVLLEVLYPQFVSSFPSATIAQFRISPKLGKTTAGELVPRGLQLFTEAQEKKVCRFQTCYPVELWPFEISTAGIINSDGLNISQSLLKTQWLLKIRVRRYDGKMSEMNPKKLRIYLNGDRLTTNFLYEAIFGYSAVGKTPVFIQADKQDTPTILANGSIEPVGFAPDENLIPYSNRSLDAYRLVQEFFAFSEKFKFMDILNIDTSECAEYFDLLIPLPDSIKVDRFRVNKDNFALGCTPIVNLFPKISEPIDLNHRFLNYRLVPDQRNEETTEIQTILKVVATSDGGKTTDEFSPYFSYDHKQEDNKQSLFWHSYKSPSDRPHMTGTDTYLSFIDFNFKPTNPPEQTAYAYTLCTNRELATYVPAGGSLQVDGEIPSSTITCLSRPTPQIEPSLDGESQWRLISQLSLNHLTLSGSKQSVAAIKEILRLYSGTNKTVAHPEIKAISDINYSPVTKRMGYEAWRGFVRGVSIKLTSNAIPYSGDNTFLLASVLNEFFSLYAGINSFTELSLTSTQTVGLWKQWPAQIGNRNLL